MPEEQIVISVEGGIVQDVFGDDPAIQVVIIDWDVNGSEPGIVEACLPHKTLNAFVSEQRTSSLRKLAGSDIEATIDAAFQQGVLDEATV